MPVLSKHMKKYELWLEKFGLDKKPHQMEGMIWCLKHELSEEHAKAANPRGDPDHLPPRSRQTSSADETAKI